jgi:hypothetical protein
MWFPFLLDINIPSNSIQFGISSTGSLSDKNPFMKLPTAMLCLIHCVMFSQPYQLLRLLNLRIQAVLRKASRISIHYGLSKAGSSHIQSYGSRSTKFDNYIEFSKWIETIANVHVYLSGHITKITYQERKKFINLFVRFRKSASDPTRSIFETNMLIPLFQLMALQPNYWELLSLSIRLLCTKYKEMENIICMWQMLSDYSLLIFEVRYLKIWLQGKTTCLQAYKQYRLFALFVLGSVPFGRHTVQKYINFTLY